MKPFVGSVFSGQSKHLSDKYFDITKYIKTCTDELDSGNVDVVLGYEMFMQACELCDARLRQARVQEIVLENCDKYALPSAVALPGMQQSLFVQKTLPNASELVTNLSIAIAFLTVACLTFDFVILIVAFIRAHPNGMTCSALNGCTLPSFAAVLRTANA